MRRTTFALAGALALAVGLFPHPAITDLPVHVTRFKLIADLLDGTARNPFYELDWRWLPNTLLDIIFAPLASVLSPEMLGRLAALLPVLVVIGTVVWCRGALHPDERHPLLHLLLALPLLLLGDTYILGLHSFMVSLCCAVAGYVALFRGAGTRLPYLVQQALAALLVGLVCWLHLGGLLGLVLLALGDGLAALTRAWRGDGALVRRIAACGVNLARRFTGLIVPVVIVALALPAYVAGMEIQIDPPPPGPFRPGAWLVTRIEAILSPTSVLFELRVLNAWWALTALCLLLLAVALACVAWSSWRASRLKIDTGLLSAMPIALLLTLVLPDVSANTAYVHWRPAFAFVLFATLAVSLPELPRAAIRVAGACAALTLALKAATFAALSSDTTRAVAEFRRASGVIEPRSSVFLTRALEGDDRPSWRRSAHVWQLRQHIAAFAALDRDALVPNLFIGRGTQNLILREPYRDFAIPTATLFLPGLLALRPTRPLGPGMTQTERVAHWRERIDYLVIAGWRVDRLSLSEFGPPLHVGEGLRIHRINRAPASRR
jgi:hypothetical protein